MATQSLYRRYRPRRFSELKGQDHVVRALRDAVMTGREGQAYLFSGPRGTGKTTSARILAKVLNCENVVDGEPCCACESCLSVERGTSYDVHELDAASNNGVDAIRDLVEKASLGTPGRHKVYILDEVHMLSKAAEAALLKTLEEPPPHVVFVLATTDPQKMSDTIRSRTQHLQFHLLPSDTLADHVRWVADDAGLDLSQAALDAALTQGGGSARDTLSALELLASTGGDVGDLIDLDEFLTGLIERDSGRVLTAMGHAVGLGRDPRTVTEDIVRHLRNAFLALMAPELVVLPSDRVDTIAAQAQQLGAAALVRAIERLGSALLDMRHAPDPRILVEVALVQLTHDEAGSDTDALMARIERLENQIKQLGESATAAAAVPKDPSTGRAVLGGAARRPTPAAAGGPSGKPAASGSTAPNTSSAGRSNGTTADTRSHQPDASDARPDQAGPSEARPGDARSNQAGPSDARPSEARPDQPGPDEARSSEARRSQPGPDEARPGDARSNEPGPSDARPDQPGPSDARPSEARPDQPGTSQARPDQPGPDEVRPSEARPDQPGTSQARPDQPDPDEVRPSEIRPSEARRSQPGPDEARPGDARSNQAGPSEARASEARPDQRGSSQVRPSGAGPDESRPRDAGPTEAAAHAPDSGPAGDASTPEPAPAAPSVSVPEAWEHTVKSQVKPLVRALYSAGSFVGNRGDTWMFSVPNDTHGNKCNEHRAAVEAALSRAVGAPVTLEFVSGGATVGDADTGPRTGASNDAGPARSATPPSPASAGRPAPGAPRAAPEPEPDDEPEPYVPEADEDVDLHDLTDAPPESVKTPIDRLAEAFPGSELMTDD